jgi:hypothetical protein
MVREAYSFCQTMKNKAGKALKSAPFSYLAAHMQDKEPKHIKG